MNYWLFLIPFITAFTGWFVLWTFFKLIFHPRKPIKIAGISIQGLFPKRQNQLAEKLGHIAGTQFFSFAAIEQKISDPAAFEKVMPMVEEHVDDFLRNKLKEEIPMLGMLIGDKTISTVKVVFMKEINLLFPEVMKQFAGTMKNELNVEQMVVSKIKELSAEKLEGMLSKEMSKEFRLIGFAGAAIGLIAGFVQLLIIFLLK